MAEMMFAVGTFEGIGGRVSILFVSIARLGENMGESIPGWRL